MSGADQAAGLRRWVQAREPRADEVPVSPAPVPAVSSAVAPAAPADKVTLMVVGLKDDSAAQTARVKAVLAAWAAGGRRWVGNADDWRIVPLDAGSDHLALLAGRQRRWALWIDTDADGFRKAYRVLQQLARQPGPRRLLVLHPPLRSSRGLLNNVRQVAAELFGIELLVLQP